MEKTRADGDENGEVTHISDTSQSPFLPFKLMESLLEKLKLLNYERSFCRQRRIKEISNTYFVLPTNPVEQFNMFANLATWLISQSDYSIGNPQESDDPNATVANILEALRSVVSHCPEFPASKLRTGSGELCIRVLDLLADSALKFKRVRHEPPQIDEKDDEGSEVFDAFEEDGSLVEWSGGKARMYGTAPETRFIPEMDAKTGLTKPQALKRSVHRDEASLGVEPHYIVPHVPFSGLLIGSSRSYSTIHDTPLPDLPQIKVEEDNWQMELERVLPQLHLVKKSGVVANDWQTHLEQFKQHRRSIEKCFAESREHLKHLEEGLLRDINKISNREKYINSQVKDALEDYGHAQSRLRELKEAYAQAKAGIAERSAALAKLTEDIEKVKVEMEQRGSSMTDSSPVIRIKQAIQRLKAENVAMEIRIGVLEHTLLRSQLRAREESQRLLLMRPSSLDAFRRTGEDEIV